MLKGIAPCVSPDLLKVLAEMGHGDEIILADAHLPGHTFNDRVLRAAAGDDGETAKCGNIIRKKGVIPL